MKSQKIARIFRWSVLGISTIVFFILSRFISEHAICPIGGFEMFFNRSFLAGFSIAGLFSGMVIIFFVMSVLSFIFRRAYCGYICPTGALQEFLEKLGQLFIPKKLLNWRLPKKLDTVLRMVKYLILVTFVVGAAVIGGHWMIPGDPFIVQMNLFSGLGLAGAWKQFPFAVIFFFLILALSLVSGRWFCRYLCPAGAWYALISKISPNKIVRKESSCINCNACSKACPMKIDVAKLTKVTTAECIGCRECVNVCPQKGTLTAPIFSKDLPSSMLPVLTAVTFSCSVYASALTMPLGAVHSGGGKQNHNFEKGDHFKEKGAEGKKWSFGGCSTCVACGLCNLTSKG